MPKAMIPVEIACSKNTFPAKAAQAYEFSAQLRGYSAAMAAEKFGVLEAPIPPSMHVYE